MLFRSPTERWQTLVNKRHIRIVRRLVRGDWPPVGLAWLYFMAVAIRQQRAQDLAPELRRR